MKLKIATIATLVILGFSGASWAQQTSCLAPTPACSLSANTTVSQIQIGGPGSISSNNTVPATCDGGTPGNLISAQYRFTFDRAAGTLTVQVENTTGAPSSGALTGFGFNTTSDVTLMTLASQSAGGLTWSSAFDRVRTDGVIEIPVGSNKNDIKCDGFGRVNAFGGNKGVDTGFGGGDASEILPGNQKTFVFNVTGNLANVTACSFTSVASLIPPGDKTAIAIGRFQACNGGGSAWAGPCTGGDLLVDLVSFDAKPGRNKAEFTWETGAEIDNAGFYVLAQNARSKQYTRVNDTLIPGRGTTTSGAFYTYSDPDARNGRKIKYALEDIEFDGDNTIHYGLARTIVINPDVTPINLSSPVYEQTVSRRGGTQLRWSGAAKGQTIEISSDPEFPEAATLRVRVGSTGSRSLSKKELEISQEMSALNGEGGVYWRVRGKDGLGNALESQTFFFFVTD
ncbi:MAG TPA: hypothetical protein VGK94_09860 [Candidatus Polarisedimenticolia bacterium]